MTDRDDLETTVDEPAGEPTPAATFRARQGEERIAELEANLLATAVKVREMSGHASAANRYAIALDEANGRIADLEAEVALLTSERDRAVALVREVAVAFGEWSTTPDSFVSARLLEAMASCQEFVAGEPPRGEKT